SYVPRPEWYFMPLYQLMKLVPPWMEVLIAVALPGVLVLALVALPFFDRRSTRSMRHRPVALAALVVVLGGAGLLLGAALREIPSSTGAEPVILTSAQHAGRALFWAHQCNTC